MFKDRGFIERKMKHYNQWMLDKTREPNSRYPGFPEEIAFKFIEQEYIKEYLSRPKKVRVKHEKKIRRTGIEGSSSPSPAIST